MACWDERPGEQLRLPRLLAIAPSVRDRERFGPLASTRFRERGVSGVGRLVRSQDLESAGSRKVVKCAVFALLPLSDFLPPRPRRNSEGVATPFFTPILIRHRSQLNKVCCERGTPTSNEAVKVSSKRKSAIEVIGEKQ